MRAHSLFLLLLLAPAEKPERWAVLPARADSPPPRDPTLLRLSKEIGEAIHAELDRDVVVVSREMRDDACPSFDAECPRDVASMLNAERVVSLRLADDFSKLQIRLYGAGLEKSGEIPCKWSEGLVACEARGIGKILAVKHVEPAPLMKTLEKAPKGAPKPKQAAAAPVAKTRVDAAMKKLNKRFTNCKKEGWGDAAADSRPKTMEVRFRVDERGRVVEVRLEPRGFDAVPAYACMARAVESLKFPAGAPSEEPLQYPLPPL